MFAVSLMAFIGFGVEQKIRYYLNSQGRYGRVSSRSDGSDDVSVLHSYSYLIG